MGPAVEFMTIYDIVMTVLGKFAQLSTNTSVTQISSIRIELANCFYANKINSPRIVISTYFDECAKRYYGSLCVRYHTRTFKYI